MLSKQISARNKPFEFDYAPNKRFSKCIFNLLSSKHKALYNVFYLTLFDYLWVFALFPLSFPPPRFTQATGLRAVMPDLWIRPGVQSWSTCKINVWNRVGICHVMIDKLISPHTTWQHISQYLQCALIKGVLQSGLRSLQWFVHDLHVAGHLARTGCEEKRSLSESSEYPIGCF